MDARPFIPFSHSGNSHFPVPKSKFNVGRTLTPLLPSPVCNTQRNATCPTDLSCDGESIVKGDSKEYSIAAASILAKVTRDKAIIKLQKDHKLGSGYPSDSVTVTFVKKYYKKHHKMPNFVRKSWNPVQKIMTKN